ncbi:Alpha/beta fold hydrolase [Rhodovastum atsumiense]|uniref:Alpha/beta fold hydrolase n=1 Tax=Rhodovastum atsumiense TaxID=504468 RepID=A0A5M6J2I1_9PROT|nr:alpha/beta fold hydrolase [Rhodovastum atsumiense]KAA5614714.1 alpha/beta fold hydrolase [Rhodovastum atsumiense]CAH2599750.1 Alpha/beta fold hydrolase [Rhodovastum atsumiense]
MILHAAESGEGPPLVLLHGLFGQAANFGTVQRLLAAKARVIALDLRNHGASPHAPGMSYAEMAADVLETLRARDALPCTLAGHSMGGKVAMRTALQAPEAISRLLVSDIAPVRYPPAFRSYAEAMAAIPLRPGLSRAEADAALAAVVEAPGVRAFLLQNLRFGVTPAWRIDLAAITVALSGIEDWPPAEGLSYPGPALFVSGARSDYIRPEHRPAIRALFPAARFLAVKAAGHWVHADNPTGFAAVMEAFLHVGPTASTQG